MNPRLGLLGFILAILIAILGELGGDGREVRRPPALPEAPVAPPERTPPVAPGGPALPPPSRFDPSFVIRLEEKTRPAIGTAFAVGDGLWLTARHVVDGCDVVGILQDERRGVRAREVAVHPAADVALVRTPSAGPPLGLGGEDLRIGQDGFHYGFPGGQPGAVLSRLIGRQTMRLSGRYETAEPVLAWAERRRVPDTEKPLGGISGGPVLDAAGRVVGIHVAGSVRRGRSFTAAPSSIRELVGGRRLAAAGAAGIAPRPADFVALGDALRGRWTVAKVACLVEPRGGRRGRV